MKQNTFQNTFQNTRTLVLLTAAVTLTLWLSGLGPGAGTLVTSPEPAQGQSETAAPTLPRNVILFIGDGMGQEQVDAASLYATGRTGGLSFEDTSLMPYQARVTTHSADNAVTDSAAAATAMATGRKVGNKVISVAIPAAPGETLGSPVPTVLEIFAAAGKSTGLVTTVELPDATPAGFAAHQPRREMWDDIFADYMKTKPNVLLGGSGGPSERALESKKAVMLDGVKARAVAAKSAGYTVVQNRKEMNEYDATTDVRLLGMFGMRALPYEYEAITGVDKGYDTLPHLTEMATKALALLQKNDKGFFLMIEGGRIDRVGHSEGLDPTQIDRTPHSVHETVEFANALTAVMNWAKDRKDTLVIVTADHECGAMKNIRGRGKGQYPQSMWNSVEHTCTPVPIYAFGPGAEWVRGHIDNTDVFRLMIGQKPSPEAGVSIPPLPKPTVKPAPATTAPATP